MHGTRNRSAQPRRTAALVGALGILLAACAGTTASLGPTSAPPTTGAAASLAPLASTAPSPTVEPPTPGPSEAPTPEPSATPSEVPTPEPTDTPTPPPTPFQFGDRDPATGLKLIGLNLGDETATSAGHQRFTLTWQTPTSAGTTVRVLGVTKCYADETTTNRPCVRATTHITASREVLVRKIPASARTTSWTWPNWEEIGEPIATDGPHNFYGIIVIFTTGVTSKVVVVISSLTCFGCAY